MPEDPRGPCDHEAKPWPGDEFNSCMQHPYCYGKETWEEYAFRMMKAVREVWSEYCWEFCGSPGEDEWHDDKCKALREAVTGNKVPISADK